MKLLSDMTEPETREYFTLLAQATEAVLPPGPSANGKCLFVLLVDDGSRVTQYVSNAERSGIIARLRETADRLERGEDVAR